VLNAVREHVVVFIIQTSDGHNTSRANFPARMSREGGGRRRASSLVARAAGRSRRFSKRRLRCRLEYAHVVPSNKLTSSDERTSFARKLLRRYRFALRYAVGRGHAPIRKLFVRAAPNRFSRRKRVPLVAGRLRRVNRFTRTLFPLFSFSS